jgi:hypothetical protein
MRWGRLTTRSGLSGLSGIDRQIEVFGVTRVEVNGQGRRTNDRRLDFVLPQDFRDPLGHFDGALWPIAGFLTAHLRLTSPACELSAAPLSRRIRSLSESASSTRSRGVIAAMRSNSRRRAASALLLGL